MSSSDSPTEADASLATFTSALIFNAAVAGGLYLAFCILRPSNRNVYAPRTYLVPEAKRSPPISTGLFSWILPVFRISDVDLIRRIGLDAYAFIRYLRMSLILFTIFACVSLTVVLPLNSVGQGTNVGLNRFTVGNITDPTRLWGHLVVTYFIVIVTIVFLRRELLIYLRLRHAYFLSPGYHNRPQARTILVTQIPKSLRAIPRLERLFSEFGTVERVTPVLPVAKVRAKYEQMLRWHKALEGAECAFIRIGKRPTVIPATLELNAVSKVKNVDVKKVAQVTGKGVVHFADKTGKGIVRAADATTRTMTAVPGEIVKIRTCQLAQASDPSQPPLPQVHEEEIVEQVVKDETGAHTNILGVENELESDVENTDEAIKFSSLSTEVSPPGTAHVEHAKTDEELATKRAATALKPVDAILFYRAKFIHAIKSLERTRAKCLHSEATSLSSTGEGAAFVTFARQQSAHTAAQAVVGKGAWRLTDRWVMPEPEEVIWMNTTMAGYNQAWRRAVSWAAAIGLIIVWTIIVTFVSSIATLEKLIQLLPFLAGLKNMPTWLVGIVQGIIPVIALSALMALLPMILRWLSIFEGIPLQSEVDLSVMHKYYMFLIINVLLTVTFATGIFSALKQLQKDPSSAINILAENMPKASTFFITYILLQALTASAQLMLQLFVILRKWVFRRYLWMANTPRGLMAVKDMESADYGTLFPDQEIIFAMGMSTLLQLHVTVLGLTYSVIAPLILPFAVLYFWLYHMDYRYMMLYCFNNEHSLGGRAFPRSVYHTYVAIYIFELTMLGIFSLQGATAPVILMVILVIITAASNWYLDSGFEGVLRFLPVEAAQLSEDEQRAIASAFEEEHTTSENPLSSGSQFISGTTQLSEDTKPASAKGDIMKSPNFSLPNIASDASSIGQDELANFYLHPSLREPPPIVWIPRDDGGRAQAEVRDMRAMGIDSSYRGAMWTTDMNMILKTVTKGKAEAMLSKKKVFVSGRIIVDPNRVPSPGDGLCDGSDDDVDVEKKSALSDLKKMVPVAAVSHAVGAVGKGIRMGTDFMKKDSDGVRIVRRMSLKTKNAPASQAIPPVVAEDTLDVVEVMATLEEK